MTLIVDNGTLDLDNKVVTGLTSGQPVTFTFTLKDGITSLSSLEIGYIFR